MYKILLLLSFTVIGGCMGIETLPGKRDFSQPIINSVNPDFDPDSIVKRGLKADFFYTMDESRGFVRDRKVEHYANNILARIKRASGFNIDGQVYFMPSRAINGKAHADGNIYINYGAFVQLESEASFVAMLAHEYAHLLLGHHYSDRYLAYQKRLFKLKNRVIALKYSIERSLRKSPSSSREYKLKRDALFQLMFLTEGFINPAWQRSQELEADLLAYDLLQRAGYRTSGLSVFFDYLEQSERDAEIEHEAELKALIEKSKFTDQFKIASAEMIRSFSRLFSDDHPPADERKENLRFYKLANMRYMSTTGQKVPQVRRESSQWRALKKRRTTQRIYDAIENSERARFELASGNTSDAGKYSARAERLLGGDGSFLSYQPFSRSARASYRLKKGQKAGALANLQYAKKSPYMPFSMRLEAYMLSPSASRYKALLRQFYRYESPPYVYREMISLAQEVGLEKTAKKLHKACEEKYLEQLGSCEPNTKTILEQFNISEIMAALRG